MGTRKVQMGHQYEMGKGIVQHRENENTEVNTKDKDLKETAH